MKELNIERITEVVIQRLRSYFDEIRIVKVDVSPDSDRDGDAVLRIEVVFEGKLKGNSARQIAGAARRLRPALEEFDADIYPLLSFISKIDYDRGPSRGAAN